MAIATKIPVEPTGVLSEVVVPNTGPKQAQLSLNASQLRYYCFFIEVIGDAVHVVATSVGSAVYPDGTGFRIPGGVVFVWERRAHETRLAFYNDHQQSVTVKIYPAL